MGLKTFAIFVAIAVNNVRGSNLDGLAARSPVYGVAALVEAGGESSECFRQLQEFKGAVDDRKVWGLKVMDVSGIPSPGFLYGNNLWLGSHSQCIDIQNRKPFEIRNDKVNHTNTPYDYPPFELKFAVVMMRHNSTVQYHVRLPLDFTVQLGLCLPKSCSERDIYNLTQRYFSGTPLDFQREFQVGLDVYKVRVLEEGVLWMLLMPKTIIALLIVGAVMLLTVIGTVVDVRQHNKEKNSIRGYNGGLINDKTLAGLPKAELISASTQGKTSTTVALLKCFSFYSNTKKWASVKTGSDSLSIIHGFRFWAMGWVIIVHTSFFQGDFVENPPIAIRLTEQFAAQIFSNSTYSVDSYLFLSGFLLAYLFFKTINPHQEQKKPISIMNNVKKFIFMLVNRYLRLTPTYIMVLLFCNLMYTFYSKTSALYFNERPDIVCDQYWWRNLLYINNLFPRTEMCLSWSWYLSVDMQFFVIATFLLLLSTMYFKATVVLSLLIMVVQVLSTGYKSYSIRYIPSLDDQLEQLDAIYDLPWNRIGPYMVGLIAGYILVIKLKNQLKLKERTRLALWVVFPLLNLWILFTLYTRQVSVEFSAFYMALSRPLWGLGIAWFVVAVSTGNARLLEKLLSWKAYIPLGRLTYCAYLLNPLVVTMIALGSESPITMSIPEMGITANGTIFITFLVSYLFSVLFESPFIQLSKIIFKGGASAKKQTNPVTENGDIESDNTTSLS